MLTQLLGNVVLQVGGHEELEALVVNGLHGREKGLEPATRGEAVNAVRDGRTSCPAAALHRDAGSCHVGGREAHAVRPHRHHTACRAAGPRLTWFRTSCFCLTVGTTEGEGARERGREEVEEEELDTDWLLCPVMSDAVVQTC